MKSTGILLKLAAAGMTLATAQAALIHQTANFAPGSTNWNGGNIWGDPLAAPVAGNDYQLTPGGTSETIFTLNGTAWSSASFVRDYANANTNNQGSPTSFAGDSLILPANTRFLGKGRYQTTTANWVLEGGSILHYAPSSHGGSDPAPSGPANGTWAGTISTSGNTAIVAASVQVTTLNVTASIAGSGVLTLAIANGGMANADTFLNLTGDLSGFTGTFYASSVDNRAGANSTFSITSSASLATLQLMWESPLFHYDLTGDDVTFGNLILGDDPALAPGRYDADALNALTGDTGIFSGSGAIIVIPEPSAAALVLPALLGLFARRRRI